jgi:hypothetical protein
MFSGFYHGWRIPCTQKPLSRATLRLDSFHVRSIDITLRERNLLPSRQF